MATFNSTKYLCHSFHQVNQMDEDQDDFMSLVGKDDELIHSPDYLITLTLVDVMKIANDRGMVGRRRSDLFNAYFDTLLDAGLDTDIHVIWML
jgi:hypothetical protein